VKNLWGKDKTQAALERLDQLTKDEGLSAVAQTLGVVHGIADDMRVVMGGAPYFCDFSQILSEYLFHQMERHQRVVSDRTRVCISCKTGISLTDLRVLSLFTKHQTKLIR
jgi:hypothetical protein